MILVQSVQEMGVGLFSSVTFWMRTEYKISGSTPVTFRDQGASQEMVTEVASLVAVKLTTADGGPEREQTQSTVHSKHNDMRTHTISHK